MRHAGQYYFYQNDHLGTPQKMTSVSGATAWGAAYQSFGKARINPILLVTNNLRFPGQIYDGETGLHYNYLRYYEFHAGRYFRPDPIGFKGGINFFSYTSNNPTKSIDPLGLKLYNVNIKGSRYNPYGHNLTLHVDDLTGISTYYEITGPNSTDVHVYKRSREEFIDSYNYRIPEILNKNFNPTESTGKNYDVVEVSGVNEQKALEHLEFLFQKYKVDALNYPYEWNTDNCTTFSFRAYKIGNKEFTPDPYDLGEAPWAWPRDLNQSIRYHNNRREP
jgi:RHS repeat-associated protein